MSSFTPGWGEWPPALLEFLTERHLATLTTLRRDGTPHVVPVGVVLDHEQECAWVITDGGSAKARHLATPSPVAVASVEGRHWATIEGTAVARPDAESVARACERYAERYRQPRENPTRVALRIEVSRVLCSGSLL